MSGQRGGPGVGQQVGPLQGGELGKARGQCQPVCGFVADPEHAPSTRIDDGQALRRRLEADRGLVEDEPAGGGARLPVSGQSAHGHGDVPCVADGGLDPVGDLAVGEGLLFHCVAFEGDQWVPTLEDEGVHHVAHRFAARFFQRVPQVGRHRVGVGVRGQVGAHAVPEDLGPDVLLQHPQDGRTFFVRQEVEHALCLFGRSDRVLDGSGRMDAIDRQGRFARGGEAHPAIPGWPERIDAEHLHEGGEGLVEPDTFPPAHRHEVAEPHVRHLVRDDVGHPFQLGPGRACRIDQEGGVAEGDATEILHGPSGEVGNGDQVDLVPRVGNPEVFGEETE